MQGTQIPGDTGTSRRKGDNVSNKQLESRIAKMVREDSKTLVRPTSTASLMALAPGLSADITDDAVIDLVSKEKYWDIKRVRAVTRHNYLFSNMYLTQEQAERSALIGEFKTDLVDRVRESSREERPVRLSSVASVGPGPPDARNRGRTCRDCSRRRMLRYQAGGRLLGAQHSCTLICSWPRTGREHAARATSWNARRSHWYGRTHNIRPR